ncbi:MAG: hypothetical protein HQ492_04010 [Woeseiaceae bacterium]|nr:hypothetical protein [Woeseiaceae bacterium]
MTTGLFQCVRRHFVLATVVLWPAVSFADHANCEIVIEDINAATTYSIAHTFIFEKGGFSQRKKFRLPGTDFSCTLAFHDLDSGTMLSCEHDGNPLGEPYFQSDRTGIEDDNGKNHLTFKVGETRVSIKSMCR